MCKELDQIKCEVIETAFYSDLRYEYSVSVVRSALCLTFFFNFLTETWKLVTMDENEYHFQITLNTSRGESVGVVGSCPQLGSWHFPNGVLLTRRIGSGDKWDLVKKKYFLNNDIKQFFHQKISYEVWTGAVRLPSNEEIQFRYFTCIVVEETLIVRRWEANILPRTIISGKWNVQRNTVHSSRYECFIHWN